jgi:hypothetical protein
MKLEAGVHLKSIEKNFQLQATELELEWKARSTIILPQLNPKLSTKLLHKLLIHNIHKIKHISMPNGTDLMSPKDFQTYYKTPTKLNKNALNIVEQLFCHPRCNQNCSNTCSRHPQARTLIDKYISENSELTPNIPINPIPQPTPQQRNPPTNIKNNPLKFSINAILNHKTNETKDKYKIITKYNTYLCQWTTQNNVTYNTPT